MTQREGKCYGQGRVILKQAIIYIVKVLKVMRNVPGVITKFPITITKAPGAIAKVAIVISYAPMIITTAPPVIPNFLKVIE